MQPTRPDFRYRITPTRGADESVIDLHLNADQQRIRIDPEFEPPHWTRLDYHQCSHCPLDPADHARCPLALTLASLLPDIAAGSSHDLVSLSVETPERDYHLETTLQRALGSLFGLAAPLSGCPHTKFLRPMALFHLPVSTERETVVRALAFRLLQRYMDSRRHPELPVNLDHLDEDYRNLNRVNRDFVQRVRPDAETDASVNALLLLEILSREMNWELEDELATVADLFEPSEETGEHPSWLPRVNSG